MSNDLQARIAELKLKAQELREGTPKLHVSADTVVFETTGSAQEAVYAPAVVDLPAEPVSENEPTNTTLPSEQFQDLKESSGKSEMIGDDKSASSCAAGLGCVVPGWGTAPPAANQSTGAHEENAESAALQRGQGGKKTGMVIFAAGASLVVVGMLTSMFWPSKPQPGGLVAADIEPPKAVVLAPLSSVKQAPAVAVQPQVSSAKAPKVEAQQAAPEAKPAVPQKKSIATEVKTAKKPTTKLKSIAVSSASAKKAEATQIKPELAWETVNLAGVGDVKTRVVGNETVIKVPASSKAAAVKVLAGSSKAQEDCGQGATCFRISNSDVSEQK